MKEARAGTQGRNLKSGIETESTEESYLFSQKASSADLLIQGRSACLGKTLPTIGWAPCIN